LEFAYFTGQQVIPNRLIMKARIQYLVVALILVATINTQFSTAHAQGTAFTYQGRLNNGGSAANGSYDLSFTVFDAVTGGNVIGSLTNSATSVSNGLFTAALDFGGVFTGTNYWLEIGARTNGNGVFATLSPRQSITPTPYAIYSASAGSAATANTANTAVVAATANAVSAANIIGTISQAQLPPIVITNASADLIIGGTNAVAPLTVPPHLPAAAVGSVATGSSPHSVAVSGRYAYVVNSISKTIQVFDVSIASAPVVVGSAGTGNQPTSIAVSGRYAYVVNVGGSTLQIFDVGNPAVPVSVGSVGTGSLPFSVAVSGRYAYVVNNSGNTLQTFDVSNPSTPVSVGSVSTGNQPTSIAVSGRYAYVANFGSGTLQIFDISNPTNVVSVGSVGTGNTPYFVAVSGSYAYVANVGASALQIFNVSNPTNAISTGSVSTGAGSGPYSVAVAGRYAYVANQTGSLSVFDVSIPSAPVSAGSVGAGSNPYSVAVSGRYTYVVNAGSSTLQVFDMGGAYIQQFEAGTIETGTLQTRDTAAIGNNLDVRGGLTVSGSARFSGGLSVNGTISGNGGGLTNINASQLSGGTFGLSQLPSAVVTNNETGVTLNGAFAGSGSGLTNINATTLGGTITSNSFALLSNGLNAETNRAISAEAALGSGISSETGRAQSAEGSLAGNINSEAARATSAESNITSNLNSETIRATSAESLLTTGLNNEVTRATTEENSLSTNMARLNGANSFTGTNAFAGVTIATNAGNIFDGTFTGNLSGNGVGLTNVNATTLGGSITSNSFALLSNGLNNETNRAISTEAVLGSGISSETGRAQSAEGSLAGNINSEVTRATSAESTITSNLNSETIRATSAESLLTTGLNNEVTRATTAENSLSTNMARLNGSNSFNGTNKFASVTIATNAGNIFNGTFGGSGAGLTSLNASQITSGTIPLAQLPGSVLTNNNALPVLLNGTFTGIGTNLNSLNANNLTIGTVPLARLSGITSNQLDAATWQLATNLNGGNAALATNVVSGISITNAFITNTVFAGNGSGLTNVNATTLGGTITSNSFALLSNGLNAETNRAQTAEGFLAGNINNEVARATSAESTITSNLNSETIRATTAESLLTTGLNNEVTRATTAENSLSTNMARLNGTNSFTGTNAFAGVTIATNAGNIFNGTFAGSGAGLTSLNASQLSSGTIPVAQLPSAVVTNNEPGVTLGGSFTGNGGGLTNLDASQLTSIGNTNGGVDNFFEGPSGNSTITGNFNTGIGSFALVNDTTGHANTADGYSSLLDNTTGDRNTAIGVQTLNDNTSGSNNVANGFAVLFSNTSGFNNTAVGVDALFNNTNGFGNVADGYSALFNNTSGIRNTAIGVQALNDNTSGSNNIALGDAAGFYIATGSSNIDIGNLGVATDTNIIRIGSGQAQAFIAGVINGDGSGLTNVNATTLGGSITSNSFALLSSGLNTETNRAQTAEGSLAGNLYSEVTRATSAESTITSNLNSETIRATTAESLLTTGLNNEVTRATTAENSLSTNMARLNGTNSFTGTNTFADITIATNAGNIFNGTFMGSMSGNGGGLTNLNIPSALNEASVGIGATNVIAPLTVTPTLPISSIGQLISTGGTYSVAVSDHYAYAVGGNEFQVYDVSDPSAPVSVGQVSASGARSIVVAGRYAYTLSDLDGDYLVVWDVSNPENPYSVGSIYASGYSSSIAVAGHYVFVTEYDNNAMDVFDVSDPSNPVYVGSISTGSEPASVAVSGNYAYVVNSTDNTLQIIDVSDPSNPVSPTPLGGATVFGFVSTGPNPQSVAVSGGYAYVVCTNNTLQAFDVGNPISPVALGTVATGSNPVFVAVAGRYAYVANSSAKTVQVFDVGSPTNMFSLGTVSPGNGSSPTSMAVVGRYVYASGEGLDIFNMGGAYIQHLEAGAMVTGTLQTRDTVTVGNNLDVSGGLTVNGSARVTGGLSVDNGTVTAQSFSGNGSGLVNLAAGQLTGSLSSAVSVPTTNLTGVIPTAQLPAGVLTNNSSGVTLNGTFTGNIVTPTTGNYVFAYDTTSQTIITQSFFQDITFNTNSQLNGWIHTAGSASFTNNQTGLYLVQYTAEASDTSLLTSGTVSLIATLNGTEIPGSQSSAPIPANSTAEVSKSFIVSASAGNTLKFQWTLSNGATGSLVPNTGSGTTRPSVSCTIIRIQ